ncbi:hypothetical protein BH23ACT10_BH23ACT10_25830 [soil metagenome]
MPSTPEHQQHHETIDHDQLDELRGELRELRSQLTAIRATVAAVLDGDGSKRADR